MKEEYSTIDEAVGNSHTESKEQCASLKRKVLSVPIKPEIKLEAEEEATSTQNLSGFPIIDLPGFSPPTIAKKPRLSHDDEFTVLDPNEYRMFGKDDETMFIYTSTNKKFGYEFERTKMKSRFICHGCIRAKSTIKKTIYAYIRRDEEGNEYAEVEAKNHVCNYQRIKKTLKDTRIDVGADNYEIIEHDVAGVNRQKILVFSDDEQHHCYKFTWSKAKQRFICSGCNRKKKYIFASMVTDETGEVLVSIQNKTHVCEPIKYEPWKYFKKFTVVRKPNYELIIGSEKKHLFIFDTVNRGLCYEYTWSNETRSFKCSGCTGPIRSNTCCAEVIKESTKEEHVRLFNHDQHDCSPQVYNPEATETLPADLNPARIIQPGSYEFRDGEVQLCVVHPENDQLCYQYTRTPGTRIYYCAQCKKKKLIVSVNVFLDGNGDRILVASEDHHHVCDPVPYSGPVEIPRYDDFLFAYQRDKHPLLIVFVSSEKKECYVCNYEETYHAYVCRGCWARNKGNVRAKVHKGPDGKEYVQFQGGDHVCKYREYDAAKYETHERIGPDRFEFVHSLRGKEEGKLIIFKDKSKRLGYDYAASGTSFKCSGCASKDGSYVVIYPRKDLNGETFIETNGTRHVCQPIDLVQEGRYIESSKFGRGVEVDGQEFITTRAPGSEDIYYKYSFDRESNGYCCILCKYPRNKKLKTKCVTAKICHNSDGEEFVLLNNHHFCKPLFFEC